MDKTTSGDLGADVHKLVTIHRNSTRQLHLIDTQLDSLTKKVFTAQMNGDRGLMLQLLTRKSVLNGVRRALNQLIQKKAGQIVELSPLTIEDIEGSTSGLVTGRVLTSDELAPNVTETFCLFSRCG